MRDEQVMTVISDSLLEQVQQVKIIPVLSQKQKGLSLFTVRGCVAQQKLCILWPGLCYMTATSFCDNLTFVRQILLICKMG